MAKILSCCNGEPQYLTQFPAAVLDIIPTLEQINTVSRTSYAIVDLSMCVCGFLLFFFAIVIYKNYQKQFYLTAQSIFTVLLQALSTFLLFIMNISPKGILVHYVDGIMLIVSEDQEVQVLQMP